jgi:hypothetical protein
VDEDDRARDDRNDGDDAANNESDKRRRRGPDVHSGPRGGPPGVRFARQRVASEVASTPISVDSDDRSGAGQTPVVVIPVA